MHDELTRPLGLPGARRTSRLATVAPLALAVLCVAAGAGGFFVWSQFNAPQPEPTQIADTANEPVKDAQIGQPAAPARQQARAASETGQDAEPLRAVEPVGSIEPVAPVPEFRRQEEGLAHLPDPELVEKGASGVIPKRSSDGLRAMDVYSRPSATQGNFGVARVVLIVGGLGISQTSSQEAIRKLPASVTLAFAPYGNSLQRWMQEARRRGHELLLQVPMEPFDYPRNNPGPHTLLAGVSAEENIANLHWAMSRITNYVGVVNFLGGRFIADPEALKPVFDELASRGLLFVDDGSVRNSLADTAAERSLLPFSRAAVQIDAVRTRKAIAAQLDELTKQAKRTGLAIGTATAFSDSVELIAQFAKSADSIGIEITPVSAAVRDPERPR